MVDLGCGAQFAKCIILFINIVFTLIGIVLLGFGIFLVIDTKALHNEYLLPADSSSDLILASATVILIVGLVILLISIIGCCATAKESTGCLTFYACILIFLVILQIAAVIIAGVFYNQIIYSLGNEMLNMVKQEYGKPDRNETTEFIDNLQSEMKCCGVTDTGPLDWKTSYFHNKTAQHVPGSCCKKNGTHAIDFKKCQDEAYTTASDRSTYIYTEGCDAKLDAMIKKYVGILVGVVIGLLFVQIVFITVVCLLKSRISSGYEYV